MGFLLNELSHFLPQNLPIKSNQQVPNLDSDFPDTKSVDERQDSRQFAVYPRRVRERGRRRLPKWRRPHRPPAPVLHVYERPHRPQDAKWGEPSNSKREFQFPMNGSNPMLVNYYFLFQWWFQIFFTLPEFVTLNGNFECRRARKFKITNPI